MPWYLSNHFLFSQLPYEANKKKQKWWWKSDFAKYPLSTCDGWRWCFCKYGYVVQCCLQECRWVLKTKTHFLFVGWQISCSWNSRIDRMNKSMSEFSTSVVLCCLDLLVDSACSETSDRFEEAKSHQTFRSRKRNKFLCNEPRFLKSCTSRLSPRSMAYLI